MTPAQLCVYSSWRPCALGTNPKNGEDLTTAPVLPSLLFCPAHLCPALHYTAFHVICIPTQESLGALLSRGRRKLKMA